jgi:hypothetical protein
MMMTALQCRLFGAAEMARRGIVRRIIRGVLAASAGLCQAVLSTGLDKKEKVRPAGAWWTIAA